MGKLIRNFTLNKVNTKFIIREDATCSAYIGGVKLFSVRGIKTSIHETEASGLASWLSRAEWGALKLGAGMDSVEVVEINDLLKTQKVVDLYGDVRKNAGLAPRYYYEVTREAGENCFTGGDYGFSTRYTPEKSGFRVSYHTTAEFDYCPYCGRFFSNNECVCSGEYKTVPVLPSVELIPVW
jgi:hypothetical protein